MGTSKRPRPGGGVDYEQAWARLQAYVTTKSQHGQTGLLLEMASIAEDCQVPGDGHAIEGEAGASVGDSFAAGTDGSPSTIDHIGGHRGSSNERATAAVG